MLTHLPVLQVVVPLLAAPACLLLDRARLAWLFALMATTISLVISALLLYQVNQHGTLVYALGGWDAPWGIEYRIDLLAAYVLLVVSGIATLVIAAMGQGIALEIPQERQPVFYVIYLLCLAGLLGIVATGDIFNVFVFLEISSLATYALIAHGQDRRALWASYQYLIVGTIGATFILIGIGFLYSLTGTLNMQDLAQRIPETDSVRTAYTAFAFLVVGICLKLALFPLHLWLPNAYAYAPSLVTAFLAATATKVAVYLLIRVHFSVFGEHFVSSVLPLHNILITLGLIGVFVASLVAIFQTNIKRLFAYSSIAQIGYMIVGIGFGTAVGVQATLLHLFNHALMKGALFMALAAVVYRLGSADISAFRGLGRQMPWTMAAIVIGGLSLIGMPLTVGFVSKWYLVLAAIEADMWPIALLILAGSILAVVYVWRLVETAYFPSGDEPMPEVQGTVASREAPLALLIPTWLLVVVNIYLGIDTRLTVGTSGAVASALLGVGQ
ncbi:monovalent cation/H+ antiporter subunit D family protein [Porticoccus litoralis]|uniref:Monovalent cation/H+ antiporter subunit D family protein n=1 Tax=Porticoccus litoralis TaxID=434086 RepID=A0AAW8AXB5_9GAMM|nr:monovalent cation/H+ antiporter subunit D family protein [Porticoccus litoralis]MDP1519675.1 monovalent cation/H+ antiporter subunit D family protein [Porticoccus litoralis]